jgi:hypothetical protein
MLTPQELELLTGHVDGELSGRDRRQLDRLLQRSAEARALLESLMSDSHEVQLAPAVPAPFDFSANVLDTIAARKVQPARATPPAVARPLAPYFAYVAAAAILLAVGVGSFLAHWPTDRPTTYPGPGMARKTPEPPPKTPREEIVQKDPEPGPTLPPWVEWPTTVRVVPAEEPDEPEEPEVPAVPAPREGPKPMTPVLASGQREGFNQLERVEFALPRVHIFHGLDKLDQGKALREQLGLGSGYRVEIPARDAGRGLERLRVALSGKRATLTYTAETQSRLKKGPRSDYAVFLENIAPQDLASALQTAGTEDRNAAQKRSMDLYFDGKLVVREFGRVDRRELKDLLGLDPLGTRPSPPPPAGVDIRRPIEESTGAAVAGMLEGRGVPRPREGARGPSVGIVLPLHPRMKSAEVKKFLETRPPMRPGTLQVLIVLRNVG